MLLIVHQCFLMMLSRKIIVRKTTLQTTNKFFAYLLNAYLIVPREKFQILKNGSDYQGAWPLLLYTVK